MNDLIDRKEILRTWQNVCIGMRCCICQFHDINDTMDEECLLERWVHSLPSAEPRKTGKWINAYPDIEPNPMFMYGICSVCGFEQSISDKLKYCPNCGADMRGGKE